MPTTSNYQCRSRVAGILFWLAFLLIASAQFLPWEIVPVYPHDTFATANTSFSQIPHSWTFSHFPSAPNPSLQPTEMVWVDEPVSIRSEPVVAEFPKEIRIYQLKELSRWASTLPALRPSHVPLSWALVALVAWPLTFLSMLVVALYAEPLSRARPILWFVRFFALSMCVWLLRNFTIAFEGIDPFFDTVGAGYWLTLVALVLEITALFLIPNAAKHHLLQSA
ncbi:MAG: hypothetical protein QM755_24200 [Luteolibacter sp.]